MKALAAHAGSLLLVDLDPRVAAQLHQSEVSRTSALWTGSERAALEVVEQNEAGADAVLVGAGIAQPLQLAQKLHALDPDLAVVILTAPSRHAALVRAVSAAPLLGREVHCHPFTDDVSALVQVLAAAADATRSRRAHRHSTGGDGAALGAPGRYLGQLLEAAPIGVLETDSDGRILAINAKACALLECTERLAIGAAIERLLGPEAGWERLKGDAPRAPRVIERARASGEPQTLEITIGVAPAESPGARLLVLLQDVTERVRAERSLRFLVEATLGLDESRDVQRTAERVARIAVPQLADECSVELALGGERRRVAHVVGDAAASGDAPRSVLEVPIHVHGRALGVLGLALTRRGRRFERPDIALAEDLARRAGFAIENARLFEELRHADRAKDDFLSMLAHELRNPLAPILTATRLLEGRVAPDDRALDVIDRQTRHMARIVDDLLDVSRIARGKVQIERGPVDLAELAREVAEDFRDAAAHSGLALHVAAPEALPVSADRTRLSQVLGNLLSNAIKFSRRGGRIDVRAARVAERAVVSVADEGVGLDPELLGAIFEPFVQADRSLDRTRGGLGLGLAIVRGIVELHGGQVVARSDGPGRGATFSFELPLAAAVAPAVAASPIVAGAARPRRILIIDDNLDLGRTLADLLLDMGHEVEHAPDGPSGLALARARRPDLVFCDIGLPGMSGYEVAGALRVTTGVETVRLVALTGYGREQDRARAFESGFDDYITKPMTIATLERILAGA